MDDFLKMNVFFVVTTVVVFCGGLLLAVALFYVIRILRSVDNVARNVSEESDSLRGDLSVLRSKIREEGMKIRHFTDFFGRIVGHKKTRRKSEEKK
ncbi:MAG: hypothetical protein A2942_02605 [Candidatus Lloydbacteria bacterium RIFCSPLOWO2_01_FULL_50_20]|uniref:Uncharacterized protein n=1 Tax=Candidatus Lloydbacteria bacterium RIFCSPLOWO2_01_FULL_50_20 TaxID=1798665 RepID=A0A1G2DH67_9BACT|nr:MAG: hypothetical protein A3C13_01955 [Candidatus Lloydbacteria bacterium RIFCSPHIGHO2_02_FULL_50_11]OGZ12138.1 MAG: hypothetical protein A2942_02605 [Candidatus Lloydbacteria bacterium RIFCSPLOWO2_01_FULL_50_20]